MNKKMRLKFIISILLESPFYFTLSLQSRKILLETMVNTYYPPSAQPERREVKLRREGV